MEKQTMQQHQYQRALSSRTRTGMIKTFASQVLEWCLMLIAGGLLGSIIVLHTLPPWPSLPVYQTAPETAGAACYVGSARWGWPNGRPVCYPVGLYGIYRHPYGD
jgi:hypothetical protein